MPDITGIDQPCVVIHPLGKDPGQPKDQLEKIGSELNPQYTIILVTRMYMISSMEIDKLITEEQYTVPLITEGNFSSIFMALPNNNGRVLTAPVAAEICERDEYEAFDL